MSQKRVLITGMSGLIGSAVRQRLEGTHTLHALNRRPSNQVDCFCADIADLDAIRPAFEDVDVVVHLAAIVQMEGPFENIQKYNVTGTYNVFEAARQAGVKRIVFASSGSVISGWEAESPYRELVAGTYDAVPDTWEKLTHETPVRPTALYGCSKVWGESIGRHFSDAHGLSVICLRIGHVSKEDRPTTPRDYSVWCSQRDIAQMVARCIDGPVDLAFDIFYAVSNNRWSYRDITHAHKVVGYTPEDAAEDHRG